MAEEIQEIPKNVQVIESRDLINMDAVTEYRGEEIVYRITDASKFMEGDIDLTFEVGNSKSHILIHPHEITREDGGFVINHDGKIYKVRSASLS